MKSRFALFSRDSVVSPTVVCAIVFFLASADRLFTIRTDAVNVRLAAVVLLAAFAVFAVTRRRKSNDDIRALTIAWLPFVAMYALAAATSQASAPAMLKLGWFAFDFLVVFAAIALFDARDVARGYFLSYLVIASIIAIDFVTGFTRGTDHMIGYGQANDMVPGMLLFRPHAFYYEPSFAASGLALAWALALTRMRDAAPKLASALVVVGAIALVVMTSRIGWLYAPLAAAAVLVFRYRERTLRLLSLARVSIPILLIVGVLWGVMAFSDKRDAIGGLVGRLGFAQAFERVCPLIADAIRGRHSMPLGRCASRVSRRRPALHRRRNDRRTTTCRTAHGRGDDRAASMAWRWRQSRDDRFIAAPPVANLWVEVALEGGLVTLLAFVFGVTFTLWRWGMFEARHRDIMIVFALWLLIVWQFIQTFPRLDLWIAFWVVLVWTRRGSQLARVDRPYSPKPARRRTTRPVVEGHDEINTGFPATFSPR